MDLNKFKLFDPTKDSESIIPNTPGNYVFLLRPGCKLPTSGMDHEPSIITYGDKKYELIYTGISEDGLRNRDYHQHFTGNNAGRSTFRKSLGSLMGLEKTYRSAAERGKTNPKTKFTDADEIKLSEWMRRNLLLLFMPNDNPKAYENTMIMEFNPPLNLQGNSNFINSGFRKHLSELRKFK